ncbi:hypothetical protein [Streptomyces sp. NPDC050485]|uniref:hypothetical protein n=1 Tax=Streptomyces sp. NPDC050485 TaxID=3365617 RepID=UPI0037B73F4F
MAGIHVGRTVQVLGGKHQLTVDRLDMEPGGVTFHYTVSPPLPEVVAGGGMLLLYVTATDDQGNVYTDGGGAFGTAPDGSHTEGSVTVQPAPPAGVRDITVDLVLSESPTEEPHHRFTVRIG